MALALLNTYLELSTISLNKHNSDVHESSYVFLLNGWGCRTLNWINNLPKDSLSLLGAKSE